MLQGLLSIGLLGGIQQLFALQKENKAYRQGTTYQNLR